MKIAHNSHSLPLRRLSSTEPCPFVTRSARSRAIVSVSHARLSGVEPGRFLGTVGQVEERRDADEDGGQPLDEKQPLPSAQSQCAVELQQRLGDRRADDHRHGNGRHEERVGLRAMRGRDPVGEIEDHAREETGLGDAKQHAEQVEARHATGEHHRHRDHTPADHDSRDPAARSHAFEDQVARHLEQAVAQEEQAGAEPEGGVGQPEVALQLGGRQS